MNPSVIVLSRVLDPLTRFGGFLFGWFKFFSEIFSLQCLQWYTNVIQSCNGFGEINAKVTKPRLLPDRQGLEVQSHQISS